ncbi:MAG TPA: hydroxymethylglutaryl-CoA synthase [Steroidobacteraceae bacterium]|nr:hydroxymethylglutaryl-CoA synthase [Steroidobacteraceae bacterium]
MEVGIEKLWVYPCALSLEIAELCAARGLDAANFRGRLLCEQRSVMSPFEDVVTLAVNAALPMLDAADRDAIRLLIVATESAPDQEKPVSSWVHHYLGLRSDCRNFEVKHACYGATGALQVATGWLLSGLDPGAKALIVNADHALIGLEGPQEPVLGAGSMAALVSTQPRVVAFEPGWNGVHAHEVADIFRPAPGFETGNADESLMSYLDALEASYDAYVARVGQAVDFDRFFAANIYHVPFGGLAQRAHLRLARRELGLSKAEAERHWARKSEASLAYNRRMGGVYGAATFVALAGLVDTSATLMPGDRLGIYAYGSGSCAEFYSVTLASGARETIADVRLRQQLDARRPLSIAEYEACERSVFAATCARDFDTPIDLVPGLYQSHYEGQNKLVFRGTRDHYRSYSWT